MAQRQIASRGFEEARDGFATYDYGFSDDLLAFYFSMSSR